MSRRSIVWTTLVAGLAFILAVPDAALAQQTGSVTGTVVDSASGQPIVGARVAVVGAATGTLSDRDGRYTLTGVPAGTVRVHAQRIGFVPVDVQVTVIAGGTVAANLSLPPAATRLSEVVVTGYGTSTRADVSGAVTSVQAADIANTPAAGVDAAIQGRMAGVQVTQNAGNPGVGVTVRIRGSASISASNQPLYVIDGVPLLRDDFSQLDVGGQDVTGVTGISPDEVESIDVLKDAASAAIYGSRGSNGVVMITTKRGRAGATRVTFNTYAGSQVVPRSNWWDLMNASEYLEYMNEAASNDGYGVNYFGSPGDPGYTDTDWQAAVFRTAPIANAGLSVSGGNERLRYYVAGSHLDQEGVVLASAYNRQSGRVNVDFTATDRLRLQTSLTINREDHDRIENDNTIAGVGANAIALQPYLPATRSDGSFTTPDGEDLEYENPLAIAEYNFAESRGLRAVGSLLASYDLARGVALNGRLGMDVLNLRDLRWFSPRVGGSYAESVGGESLIGNTTATRYVFESFLEASPSIGTAASLSLVGGTSVEWNGEELDYLDGITFASDAFQYPGNAATVVTYRGDWTGHNLASFFARANATWRGRYLLTASLRADGSSRFGANNRYGIFPAASLGWKVTEEPFAQSLARHGDLKLRVSYGVTGNHDITDNFAPQPRFSKANYVDVSGHAKSAFGNPDLRWEQTHEFNVGFDLVLLQGRLTILGDWYKKVTEDLLLDRPITATSGQTSRLENVGNIENKGYELAVSSVNVAAAGGLRWTTDFNIAWNRNRVTKLFNNEPFTVGLRSVNRVEVGQPLSAFYTLRYLGVDPNTGDAMFDDIDNDGDTDDDDRVIVGSPHPDFWGGLTNTLSWRGFDLRAFFQFTQGHTIFNGISLFALDGGYYHDNKFRRALRRWQQPGDVTDEPRASYDGLSGAVETSSRYFQDGSYVRLQEVTLGYRLPERWAGALRLSDARIYVSGRNLHTWTDYEGYSPDVNFAGSSSNTTLSTDFYAYPLARTIMVGITGAF